MGDFILHIGTHKTGTSSLQALLAMNARALAAAGVYVPQTGRPLKLLGDPNSGHHNIAWGVSGDRRFDPASGTFAELLDEVRSASAPLAVISSEDFDYLSSRPDALRSVNGALCGIGFTPRIVVYLRRHEEYAQSLYLELLKHGFSTSRRDFVEELVRDSQFSIAEGWIFQFRYSQLLRQFGSHFGRRNIVPRAYARQAEPAALLLDFVRILNEAGGHIDFDGLQLPQRLNPSITVEQAEELVARNASSSRPAPRDSDTYPMLTSEDIARLRDRFSGDTAVLAKRYSVRFDRAYAAPRSWAQSGGASVGRSTETSTRAGPADAPAAPSRATNSASAAARA